MHVLLGWALVTGLAQRMIEVIKAPIETKIIEEVKPPPPPPPPENLPPPPKWRRRRRRSCRRPRWWPTRRRPARRSPTTTVAPPPAPVTIAPAPAPAPRRRRPRPAAAQAHRPPCRAAIATCRPARPPDYPAAARVPKPPAPRACASRSTPTARSASRDRALGRPSREHKMLDRVAVSKLSECTFKPGTDENGKPVGGTTSRRVRLEARIAPCRRLHAVPAIPRPLTHRASFPRSEPCPCSNVLRAPFGRRTGRRDRHPRHHRPRARAGTGLGPGGRRRPPPPATARPPRRLPVVTKEEVMNPYGLEALWKQGDFVAKAR
jgi:protein TonB